MPPACAAPLSVQVVVSPAVPQVVQAPPPPGQYGADTSQFAVPDEPLSPLHAAHSDVPLSQMGVPPVQFVASVLVHSWQSPAPEAPEASQTPLRQRPSVPAASATVQGPAAFA